ncbi:ankyrin-1-like [Elysia marginata]|uniref:Ankyrin-1-like n=1 Tax=Elysia marginata TaxID=1093978 RepID=A0AAV4JNB0_9GAST|nr:ankyrin-1-like [Elysia marginata]
MAGAMFEEKLTIISIAVRNNDVEELKTALKNDEDPHHTDRKGNTYLHYVCTMHRPCIFHILVTAGINVNAQNRHGNTALHVTALQNDCSHVGDLLAAGIDPTIKNKMGQTAAEIETTNRFWKTVYDKYQPGIFQAVEDHDVERVLYLLHCWTRVDCKRGTQTLRQFAASRKFHDLVFHLDKHQHTMGGIYAILEGDKEKAAQFLLHSKCNVNLLNYASETSHILQHALKSKDLQQVRMICRAKANLNIRVTLECYLKAPLFFCAFHPEVSAEIMWTILRYRPDFTLKDERGRNAAVFALDKTDRKISCEVIAFMLSNGLDVSQRDETGATLRDVARFARRTDILELIDKAYIKVLRSSDMKELKRYCIMGYDGMFMNFNHRDTFIYASGNETDDALNFIQKQTEIQTQVRQLHHGIRHWSMDRIVELLTSSVWSDILINSRDKGGRTALHLAILHWRMDLLKLFLAWDNIEVNAVTNVGRNTYHYACCVEDDLERDQFCSILDSVKDNLTFPDYRGLLPEELIGKEESTTWIQQERKKRYGMGKQLQCVDKYEELCHMMKYKGKNLKHFEKSVCRFRYPVAKFYQILSPLMPEYRDLIFVAMDKKKEDIATRLIQLGTDWTLLDLVNADGEAPVKEREKAPKNSKKIMAREESHNSHFSEKTDQLNQKKDMKNTVNLETQAVKENSGENEGSTNVEIFGTDTRDQCHQVCTSLTVGGSDTVYDKEETKLEEVTVEERARRLGMLKVLSAIEKKKIHRDERLRETVESRGSYGNRSIPCEFKESRKDGDFKHVGVDQCLSLVKHTRHGSKETIVCLEGDYKDRDGVQTFSDHIQGTVKSLKYNSCTDDESDDNDGRDSNIGENSHSKADDEYSYDDFYSEENSISDFDEYNDLA